MDNKTEIIKLAHGYVEKRLASQLASALAADQRATSVAGMLIAGATVLIGLGSVVPVPISCYFGSLTLALAAFVAWESAQPQDFYMPGANFDGFQEDFAEDVPVAEVVKAMGEFHDKHSRINDKIMEKNAKKMQMAFKIAGFSITVAAVPQFLNSISS